MFVIIIMRATHLLVVHKKREHLRPASCRRPISVGPRQVAERHRVGGAAVEPAGSRAHVRLVLHSEQFREHSGNIQ